MLENSNVLPQIEGNHDCMLWICKIIIFQVKMVYLCKQPVWIFGRVHSQNQEHPEGTCLRRRQESQHCLRQGVWHQNSTKLRVHLNHLPCSVRESKSSRHYKQWLKMENWEWKCLLVKSCSKIWFLYGTGLSKHQGFQENIKWNESINNSW